MPRHRGHDQPPAPSRAQSKARALGLTSATGLVVGSIVGTGVFAMPAVLAGAGTSSLLVLGVIAVGAMLLAVLFGQLTRRIPNSDGGLYAYARYEFGDFAGYLTGWCYWIQCLGGQRRHRVGLGVLRRRPVRHQAVGHRQLGHRADRPVDPGAGEPGRGQADGLVPEPDRDAEVPAAAVRRRGRLVLRRARGTSARSTPPAGACTARSASRPAWPCSPSSGSRSRRSPPSG